MSLAIWNHTVLPVTPRQRHSPTEVNAPAYNPSQKGWHSINLPQRDRRLSLPRWLVIYRDGVPARRQSPIQVLTGPGLLIATNALTLSQNRQLTNLVGLLPHQLRLVPDFDVDYNQ